MFLRAGLFSVALLLLSRASGILRESTLAAAFGVGAMADAVVLMLTLPDLMVGVLLSGALAYVLLPQWSAWSAHQLRQRQRHQWVGITAGGWLLAAAVFLAHKPLVALLAPALAQAEPRLAQLSLTWAAAVLPLAVWAAWGSTRLQHRSDVVGLYAANLTVNFTVIAGLALAAWVGASSLNAVWALHAMGCCLLLAMLARLAWQRWRLKSGLDTTQVELHNVMDAGAAPLSRWQTGTVWGSAVLCAGMPLIAYLLARSWASVEGAGALTLFNLAWKLVELPQVLLIQVVAMLALPRLCQAVAQPTAADQPPAWLAELCKTLALALALACAAMVAVQGSGSVLASWLYGWGQMPADRLPKLVHWAQVGAFSLPAQAVVAILVALLAAQHHLRTAALAWLLVALPLLAWPVLLVGRTHTGPAAMQWLAVFWWLVALTMLSVVAWQSRAYPGWWRVLLADVWLPVLVCAMAVLAAGWLGLPAAAATGPAAWWGLWGAAGVMVLAWWASPRLREVLRKP